MDKSPEMRWVITHDHIADIEPLRVGRGNFPLEQADQLPWEFQLFDDDGNLYYSGYCDNPNEFDESQAFMPLDFGTHDAGATEMRIRPRAMHADPKAAFGGWKTL